MLLAQAAHASNPIQTENLRVGSGTISLAPAPPRAIEGYTSQTSVLPGGSLDFHVGTNPAARYRIVIARLGWYGGTGSRDVACLPGCASDEQGSPQPVPPPQTGREVVAAWPVTDTLQVPVDWVSGYYVAQLVLTSGPDARRGYQTYFVVRELPLRRSQILVQVPVNTWQAYNGWGGYSLYEFEYAKYMRAFKVSFDRPYDWTLAGAQSPLVWELPLVRFLERGGYDVSYQTDVDTDQDPASLLQHRLVIDSGHDEYWTRTMFDAFAQARDAGTNLAFMGANDSYWQIRYDDGGRTIVSYKSFDDPVADPQMKTVRFRELVPPVYECGLIGIQSQGVGLGWRPGDYTVDPAALSDPWFTGTGFAAGAIVRGVVSVESDTIPGNQTADSSCSHKLTVFFHRELGSDKDGNADAVRYTNPSGARVFASGSHQWSWGLDSYRFNQGFGVPADPRLQRFMENGLDDLGRPAAPIAVSAGHIPTGILVRVSAYPDPRVQVEVFRHAGAAPFALTAAGVVHVCPSVTTVCLDHPRIPGTYLYEAVTQDQWSSSVPTASRPAVALRRRHRRRHHH